MAAAAVGVVALAATGLGYPARPTMAGTAKPHGRSAPTPVPSEPVVEHGGHRYAVGRPGDVAVLGDWDCDGTPTPALYRPSTGEAFVFGSWARAGRPVRAHGAGRHPPGGVVTVVAGPGGCDRLSIKAHENA